jgi:hypothetical protein
VIGHGSGEIKSEVLGTFRNYDFLNHYSLLLYSIKLFNKINPLTLINQIAFGAVAQLGERS